METTLKTHIGDSPRGFARFSVLPTLTRYIVREIVVPAILALVVIGFIGIANEIRERWGAMDIEFLTWWDGVRLAAYLSPTLISFVIPITYMMGILLAFGGLAQNNEITAMKAAGIPLKRLVIPVVVVGGLLSVFCFYLQDRVQPAAVLRLNHLIYTELPERITLEVLPTGVMHDVAGWRVYIGSRDKSTKTLKNVVILKPNAGSDWVYYADSAQFRETPHGLQMYMDRGQLVMPQEGNSVTPTAFTGLTLTLPESGLKAPPSVRHALSLHDLWIREAEATKNYRAARTKQNEEDLRKLRGEIGDRFSMPFACLAVSLIAAPLAVRAPRAGRTYSFAIGFVIIGSYYVMRLGMEPSVVKSFAETFAREFAPNVVLGGVGLVALWRVDRI